MKNDYEHTIGVMYTAAALAMAHHGDVQKAMKAGLLHDCGKYGSAQEQVERCRKQGITLTESEEKIPALAHAKLGAYIRQGKVRSRRQRDFRCHSVSHHRKSRYESDGKDSVCGGLYGTGTKDDSGSGRDSL